MMMIKGDREPGHLPSEDFLAVMGKYNEDLSRAGVLVDLAALHWSAEGVRVKFFEDKRSVTEGLFGEAKGIVTGYWILQVESMDEAIEWAKRLPFEAGGEPRPRGRSRSGGSLRWKSSAKAACAVTPLLPLLRQAEHPDGT